MPTLKELDSIAPIRSAAGVEISAGSVVREMPVGHVNMMGLGCPMPEFTLI